MASWSRDKVDSSNINGGNEYTKGSRVSRQHLNAMVNSGLYSQDFAEHLSDTPDTTNAGNVGTPSVSFVDNVVGGKTYKKFKFENLKGATGATGNGIASISKTSTSGLTDTYTITFTNGNTTTFTVKNGDSVDMRVDSGYFQWKRTQDSTWTNLIAVSAIAQVDQSLDVSSTNAISNSAVATKFNNITSGADMVGLATTARDYDTSSGTIKSALQDVRQWVQIYQHEYQEGDDGGNISLTDLSKTNRDTLATDCSLIKIVVSKTLSTTAHSHSVDVRVEDFTSTSFSTFLYGSNGLSNNKLEITYLSLSAYNSSGYLSEYKINITDAQKSPTTFASKTFLTIYGYKKKSITN